MLHRYPVALTMDLPKYATLEDGLPRLVAGDGHRYWNPSTVCIYGLAAEQKWRLNGRYQYADILVKAADWLVEHARSYYGCEACWIHEEPFVRYGTGPNWISGMAQGLAMSMLVRAHQVSGDRVYLDLAVRAQEPLTRRVSDRGVRVDLPDEDAWFFEEFPHQKGIPIMVLNGNIFAMFGLLDLECAVGVQGGRSLFRAALRYLNSRIEDYSWMGWS
ncbi:MAG TPA: hypothetical protein GX513_04735, partial [Firmicutes bacterium]|nr:hypothetical protein [Bacillota bacterium]